jgi:hypothetical protein
MLVFLTSIRHPHNSNNFAKVEKLFDISLRSVCAQVDPNFRVMVVCNARPNISFDDPRVSYHVVDFPPPCPNRTAQISLQALYRDKGSKLMAGMIRAKEFSPSYFAIFDADDYVSRRIAGYVNQRPGQDGWFIDGAYVMNEATRRVQRKQGFVRYCGTSLIPSAERLFRLSGVNETKPDCTSQQQILERVGTDFIDYVLGNHKYMVGYFAQHGLRLQPLPFRAAVWVRETGENQYTGKWDDPGVPVTPEFLAEFGIPHLTFQGEKAGLRDRVREAAVCAKSRLGFLRHKLRGHPNIPSVCSSPSP